MLTSCGFGHNYTGMPAVPTLDCNKRRHGLRSIRQSAGVSRENERVYIALGHRGPPQTIPKRPSPGLAR